MWWSEPHAYRAQCQSIGGAHVLEITTLNGAQVAQPSPTPEWGLHLLDGSIALGNLITVVKHEAAAFSKAARPAPLHKAR